MSTQPPLSHELAQRIVDLARAKMPRNEIARQLQVSPATVTQYSRAAVLSFDRSATAVATEAAKVDAAALRAKLAIDLMQDIDAGRRALLVAEAPATVVEHERHSRTLASLWRALLDVSKVPEKDTGTSDEVRQALLDFGAGLKDLFEHDEGYGTRSDGEQAEWDAAHGGEAAVDSGASDPPYGASSLD